MNSTVKWAMKRAMYEIANRTYWMQRARLEPDSKYLVELRVQFAKNSHKAAMRWLRLTQEWQAQETKIAAAQARIDALLGAA